MRNKHTHNELQPEVWEHEERLYHDWQNENLRNKKKYEFLKLTNQSYET